MIVISVRKDGITVSGHAGYAPPDQDIVCSAVSALFQTMIASIEALTDDKIEYDIQPGCSRMICENLSEVSKTLVDSFFIGICMIASEYSDFVRVV